ncbi:MAG: hypothetical protein ABIK82_17395 [Pseudomonadota bacterium]
MNPTDMSQQSTPDWFVLIEQWKPRQMGETGITLPFLVGALAYKRGSPSVSEQEVRALLDEIVCRPVSGFVAEVRWCNNIDAPVFTVSPVGHALPFKSSFSGGTGVTLGFSQDAQAKYGGLDCTSAADCLERLASHALPHVAAGNFSRVRESGKGAWGWGAFLPKERAYIEETIMASSA